MLFSSEYIGKNNWCYWFLRSIMWSIRYWLQDYGLDFDDHSHPVDAFECCCMSALCRGKKKEGICFCIFLLKSIFFYMILLHPQPPKKRKRKKALWIPELFNTSMQYHSKTSIPLSKTWGQLLIFFFNMYSLDLSGGWKEFKMA